MSKISDDIEPAANAWWKAREPRTEAEGVALSIAISLKRIADALTPQGELSDEDDRTKWSVHALLFGVCDAADKIEQSIDLIADEVCGVPYDPAPGADNSKHRMGLTDGIMHAIEQGLLAASQRG